MATYPSPSPFDGDPAVKDEPIFALGLAKAEGAERAAYLESAWVGDADQRKRIEGLLAALENAGGFLEKPAVAAAHDPATSPTRAFAPTPNPDEEQTHAHGEAHDFDT